MQRGQEYYSKGVVEGSALLESGFGLVGEGDLALRREGLELVPQLPQQWVEYKQEGQIWDILSEAAVLGVGVILRIAFSTVSEAAHGYMCAHDLAPRNPAICQLVLVFMVPRIGGFHLSVFLCIAGYHKAIRLDTVYGIQSINGMQTNTTARYR